MLTAVVLLAGCGHDTGPAPEAVTSETARENLGITMVAWEFQTTDEQRRLCDDVLAAGVSGTVDSYRSKHGGPASDWIPSAEWLTGTCKEVRR